MTTEQLMAPDAAQALKSDGFLVVTIPAEVEAATQETFTKASAFFRQSPEAKALTSLPVDLGYRPYGVEYSSSPDHLDQMESFTVRRNMPEPSWGILDETALLLINEMRGTLEHFCVIAAALVAGLARFFSQELEVAATRKSLGEWSLLQLNYARPSQTQARFINQAHEDGCLLTVASNTAQGLEIEVNRKSYTSVSIKPNQIVIMPGEILWLLSGGQIPPCYHRVRAAADVTERMSLLLFGDLNPARCSPWVSAENNRHIDIGERVLKNSRRFGLKEWGPEERL